MWVTLIVCSQGGNNEGPRPRFFLKSFNRFQIIWDSISARFKVV